MNLDCRAVKARNFHVDLDDPFCLQGCKHPAEHPVLAPPVHANIDCMPIPIGLRQSPPLAAVFRDIQYRIDKLEIRHADVASLSWKILRNLLVLLLCDLHILILADYPLYVNSVNRL